MSEELLQGERAASRIASQRIVDKTKKIYKGRINRLKGWLSENQAEVLNEDGSIKVPIPTKTVMAFLGFVSNDNGNNSDHVLSVSSLGGYRSAIVDLYKQAGMRLSTELDIETKTFMAGYKRHVAQKKQQGIMSVSEGRQPVSFPGYRLMAKKFMMNAWTMRNTLC
jgi:hypothetical protein